MSTAASCASTTPPERHPGARRLVAYRSILAKAWAAIPASPASAVRPMMTGQSLDFQANQAHEKPPSIEAYLPMLAARRAAGERSG